LESQELQEIIQAIGRCYRGNDSQTAADIEPLYRAVPVDAVYLDEPVLWYAAQHADHVGIKILIEAGADAAEQDQYGRNALHRLAYEDSRSYAPWADVKQAAALLAEAGASALRKNSDGLTCVHIAAEHEGLDIIRALAEAGKKLDLPNKNGETALHLACDRAVRAAESFYKYAKPAYDKAMAETTDGSEYQERELSRKRESQKENHDREWGKVELHFQMIKCLIEAGLDPDQPDNYGATPKQVAFDCMDIRVPALLEGSYSEGDEQDDEKRLSMLAKGMNLMQAAEKQDYDAVEALLKLGADPNELCGEELRHYGLSLQGKAPLALACSIPDKRLALLLLEYGANPCEKDADEKLPLYYCFRARKYDVNEEILKVMLEKGLDINAEADGQGNTLLNTALRNTDSDMSRYINRILRLKANPDIADNDGVTPLMRACGEQSDYIEDVQIALMEAGADVGAQDKRGYTPLMYAAGNSGHALAKTLSGLLFEFGDPKPDAAGNDGQTALAIASEHNNENLVNFLLTKI
jgi:ankyrin repeat protein